MVFVSCTSFFISELSMVCIPPCSPVMLVSCVRTCFLKSLLQTSCPYGAYFFSLFFALCSHLFDIISLISRCVNMGKIYHKCQVRQDIVFFPLSLSGYIYILINIIARLL